jgi:hypothetical protein
VSNANTAAADRLRAETAACKVSFSWFGTSKSLSASQKATAAAAFDTDARRLTAGKKLIDTKHPAYAALTEKKAEIVDYWTRCTLPYVEKGVRLIRRSKIAEFDEAMRGHRRDLADLVLALVGAYGEIKAQARAQLGSLYNEADYPEDIDLKFGVEWTYPNTEPPPYLLQLNPRLYAEEQERARSRFAEAVQAAEAAFADQLAGLVTHLAERLAPGPDGTRKVFRDTAVENFKDFFDAFRSLSVRSNPDLEALVERAQALVDRTSPEALRRDAAARQSTQAALSQIAADA